MKIATTRKMKKIMLIYKSLLFLALTLLPILSYSQIQLQGIPYIKNYTINEYQYQPQNRSILQDSRGIMYFGNSDGLVEYDGANWNLIEMPNRTLVRTVTQDVEGKIYVGAQGEFGYLEPDSIGRMQYKSLSADILNAKGNFGDIWSLIVIKDKIVAVTTNQLLVKDGRDWSLINPEFYFNIGFAISEEIFIGEPGKGLLRFRNNKLELLKGGDFFKNTRVVFMGDLGEKEVLIATEDKGLYIYNGEEVKTWQTSSDDFLIKNQIRSGLILKNGNIALGTLHNGVLILNRKGEIVQHLNREKGLQNNSVLAIYIDNSENLWLGLQNGIDYVELNSPFTYFNERTALPGTGHASVIDRGRLYLGTNQGVFYKEIDTANNPPRSSNNFKIIPNSAGQVWTLNNDFGSLLMGHDFGSYLIKNDKAIKISGISGVWKFMKSDKNPDLIFAGSYFSLLLFEPTTETDWKFRNLVEGLHESFRIMEEDKNGDIWLSHPSKGIYKLKIAPSLDKFLEVKFYDTSFGLPSNFNVFVTKIDGEIVFGTEKGIYSFDSEKGKFEYNGAFHKFFPKTFVSKLQQDNRGNIWFVENGTPGVLTKTNVKNIFTKRKLNKLQGKLASGFDYIHVIDSSNVLFGTQEGFIHYDPSKTYNTDVSFQTLIRKVELLNNKEFIYGGSNKEGGEISIPTIPYKENALSFSFSCTSFDSPDKNLYQYKLDGFDKEWSAWSNKTTKEYNNLHEGNYSFRVRSKNVNNRVSKEASYRFNISAPFYRSIPAYLFYLIFISIFLTGIIKLNSIRKDKHFKREKLKAERKIIQLENEKLEAEIQHRHRELASLTMHITSKNETLEQIKSQLKNTLKTSDTADRSQFNQIIKLIDQNISLDNNWEQFDFYFNELHGRFLERLREKYPDLTPSQLKMCAYLRMNLTSKEISSITHISISGIEKSRYRLRKKFGLEHDQMLTEFMQKI